MKYKQLYPKFVRSTKSVNIINQQHKRCSLCDSLLKTNRYLSKGKSIHESMMINNHKSITYAECCQRYLNELCIFDKLHIICLKCCDNLQRIHLLHLDAEELVRKIRRTSHKTKRLNQIRHSHLTHETHMEIKEEPSSTELISESVLPNNSYIPNQLEPMKHIQESTIPSVNSAFVAPQILSNEYESCQDFLYRHTVNNATALPYAQFMIESPISANLPQQQQSKDSNHEQLSLDDDRSLSPCTNDEENSSKNTRLSRRQYDFLLELPDQQSLNTFIQASSSEYGSRWTWRRTSANSRGYKIYYVCNFSMRRHYHPCPAAMYALFNPEGTISIYSHGQHQHVPKSRLPLSITDATKDEIFKCLQAGMSTGDIREHLIRLKLPFGDTKKLNNFIKYHKELLRFGSVTNVRLNGTAYRQPQHWAIRRSSPTDANITTTLSTALPDTKKTS